MSLFGQGNSFKTPSLLLRLHRVPVLLLQELVEGLLRQPQLRLRLCQLGLLLAKHPLQTPLLAMLHAQGVLKEGGKEIDIGGVFRSVSSLYKQWCEMWNF